MALLSQCSPLLVKVSLSLIVWVSTVLIRVPLPSTIRVHPPTAKVSSSAVRVLPSTVRVSPTTARVHSSTIEVSLSTVRMPPSTTKVLSSAVRVPRPKKPLATRCVYHGGHRSRRMDLHTSPTVDVNCRDL
jgi:hypothetical protein